MSPETKAEIRPLTADDLDAALHLSSTAGWNQRADDWRVLLRIAPHGSFSAWVGGRLVGTAIGLDYGSFGWIAMMLVDPAYRGRGLGARLLEAAMRAIPASQPIRLDATPMGRPLYQRYGFEDETMLTRHVAGTPRVATTDCDSRSAIPRMTTTELTAVLRIDPHVFGGTRGQVLEWAREGSPQYAYAMGSASNAEYCFGRPGRLFDQIGPVVAGSEEHARLLTGAALAAAAGRPVVMDVFDDRRAFTDWLRSRGFAAQRPLFRMRRPGANRIGAEPSQPGPTVAEYAILGPEFG